MKYALDSNLVMDYLNGVPMALSLLDQFGEDCIISTVTWIEVMTGTSSARERIAAETMMSQLLLLETSRLIAEITVDIRQQYRLRLPDAIIWATAKSIDACLLTRDTDYPEALDIRIPYTL